MIQVISVALVAVIIAGLALIGHAVANRTNLRRADFQALREERDTAVTRARVVNRFLTRTRGQVDLIVSAMQRADRKLIDQDERLLLEHLQVQLKTVDEDEEGRDT